MGFIKTNVRILFILAGLIFYGVTSHAQNLEPKRSFVLLIYMNGSDLESKHELASEDINEIIRSYKNTEDNFATVILHGGTKKWHFSEQISGDSLTYSKVTKEGFEKVKVTANKSIGDPSTLVDFISFSKENFPAERYGLIFWNHGRGSVHGFGYDELFPEDISLSLHEMGEAFADLKRSQNDLDLDFIGFDACLMATIETATVFAPYADYMIASQELEPGNGWNYEYIINALSTQPHLKTVDLLEGIAKSYIDAYSSQPYLQATLSVIALDKVGALNASVGNLISKISANLNSTYPAKEAFKQKSNYRARSKSFGLPSFSFAAEDMIDISSFFKIAAKSTDTLFGDFEKKLKDAVVCNVYSKNLDKDAISGLSVYFPYYNRKTASQLKDYLLTPFNIEFEKFIENYVAELIGGDVDSVFVKDSGRKLNAAMLVNTNKIYLNIRRLTGDSTLVSYGLDAYDTNVDDRGYITLYGGNKKWDARWISINDINVCAFMGLSNQSGISYNVPVLLNGKQAELVIKYFNVEGKNLAKVTGYREISPEGITDKIKNLQAYDEITFLGQNGIGGSMSITLGKLLIADPLALDVKLSTMPKGNYQVGFCMVDFFGNKHYTKFEDYIIN
ncbi:clostripain-related cysteine peptidase [uncultured Pedobacter sp.]|uniref:clostripain-related cysteine peptidase n=1 Tax=uncultured Pedobacter sp. TaxID=246139 RepID=UPI0025F0003A|nr:clostripain-related cysteine peptidase [uncultured Pedobacter sp.]